ncbi:MAG: hypothetical protein [Cressdnaviricota sp.]|nr:MAG: hypothetical protein [Cressdnaviricota sp.]
MVKRKNYRPKKKAYRKRVYRKKRIMRRKKSPWDAAYGSCMMTFSAKDFLEVAEYGSIGEVRKTVFWSGRNSDNPVTNSSPVSLFEDCPEFGPLCVRYKFYKIVGLAMRFIPTPYSPYLGTNVTIQGLETVSDPATLQDGTQMATITKHLGYKMLRVKE